MVRTIELQRDLLLANAGAAAAVGRAAPPWQLALGTLIAGFLIYHHGRAMAWMALSLSLILFQFTCAAWHRDPNPNPWHRDPNPNPKPQPEPEP